jgi:hypothetical protein
MILSPGRALPWLVESIEAGDLPAGFRALAKLLDDLVLELESGRFSDLRTTVANLGTGLARGLPEERVVTKHHCDNECTEFAAIPDGVMELSE